MKLKKWQITAFIAKYSSSTFVQIPPKHPTEMVAEMAEDIEIGNAGLAVALIGISKPHYHKKRLRSILFLRVRSFSFLHRLAVANLSAYFSPPVKCLRFRQILFIGPDPKAIFCHRQFRFFLVRGGIGEITFMSKLEVGRIRSNTSSAFRF